MTKDELVEKVARALCKAAGDNPDANGALPGFDKFPLWRDWTDAARAAIAVALDDVLLVTERYAPEQDDLLDAIRALKP